MLGENRVSWDELKVILDVVIDGDIDWRLFLCVDKVVDYSDLMVVMNVLCIVGYLKIVLVGVDEFELG